MSAALPPVPDLIPISALRKGSSASGNNNNCDKVRDCVPCTSTQCHEEVMGEQRSRRRTGQPTAAEAIDSSRSRGSGDGAAPQPQPASRKSRSERHRKSDRRRGRERERRKRSASSKSCSGPSSPERPPNPRVNPIFVWVRQKDTHIVEVKCEDYDKRNRILLTKTAQGWRAIPRTETLAPALQKSDDKARKVKRRSSKAKRKSTAVQVDGDDLNEDDAPHSDDVNRNSVVSVSDCSTQVEEDSAPIEATTAERETSEETTDCEHQEDQTDNNTPLDKLLAVAELEFNHQIKSGQWDKKNADDDSNHENFDNMEELNLFIESCAPKDDPAEPEPPPLPSPTNTPSQRSSQTTCEEDEHTTHEHDVPFDENKSEGCEECDYNEEEDESNLAMVDILSRLEQSLRSPDALNLDLEQSEAMNEECDKDYDDFEDEDEILEESLKASEEETKTINDVKTTETPQDKPTDLSTHKEVKESRFVDDLIPTDLSVPKCSSPMKRPASQNSETIQSPQPSGIPAVPPSPDVYNKSKPIYLDSLLSPNKEKEKEPLNLGKSRDTDSPKVTCSQEDRFNEPPPAKKNKLDDITLKTLLDQEVVKQTKEDENKNSTPRLLELLSHDKNSNPLLQLKQVLANASLNVPDPMLIPKDRLSQILSAPSIEIPKLLNERPELRLPEALAFPHLLQDPDILVITLAQLETIVQKQTQSIPVVNREEVHKKKTDPPPKETKKPSNSNNSKIPELSNDIDAATNAAFAQMMWLPYLNQLENAAMSFGSNAEFLKMLTSILPGYPTPMNEMTHMLGAGRVNFPPPPNFPLHPAMNYNPIEMGMWQEAMLHARNKNQFDLFKEYSPKGPPPKQNPYLNVPGQYQNMRQNLQIPQYNPHVGQQKFPNNSNISNNNNTNGINSCGNINKVSAAGNKSVGNKNLYEAANFNKAVSTFQHQQQKLYENEKFYQQQRHQKQQELLKQHETAFKHQQEMYGNAQRPKVTCKPFANISQQEGGKRYQTGSRVAAAGAIDLSGPQQGQTAKLKVRQHLVDHANAPRLLKHDDIPEVGSTTASIEEMQDAQKHLWHPLFGSQKGYTSPWNWTTVTATGE